MRSKSPRSVYQQKNVSPQPNARSRSVPHDLSPSPPRRNMAQSPKENNPPDQMTQSDILSQLDTIFDFFINEITIKQFFTKQRKKELLNLARSSKQNGNKYITSRTKSQVLSNQFWVIWNSFQTQLEQELDKHLTQNFNSLSRYLVILQEAVDSIKSSKKSALDLQIRANELIDRGNNLLGDSDEIAQIYTDFRQFNNDIIHEDVIDKQPKLKLKFTSTTSQILTLLKSIKDINICQTKFRSQFDDSISILEASIPLNSSNQNSPSQLKCISPAKKTKQPKTPNSSHITKQPPNKRPPSIVSQTPTVNRNARRNIDDDDDDELKITKKPKQVNLSNDLRGIKNKPKKLANPPFNEISQLQDQIAGLSKVQSNPEEHEEIIRNPIQFQNQFEYLANLHAQKRALIHESCELKALTESLLSQLEAISNKDPNIQMLSKLFKKNFELRNTRNQLNEDLFFLRKKCLHINQIAQRSTLPLNGRNYHEPSLTTDEIRRLKKEYTTSLDNNKVYQNQLKTLNKQLVNLEKTYTSLLVKKFNQVNGQPNTRSQLDNIKESYRSKMEEMIVNQTNYQNLACIELKDRTNSSLRQLRKKLEADISKLEQQKREFKLEFDTLSQLYNEAISNGDETIEYESQTLEVDEVESLLNDLKQNQANLDNSINRIKKDEKQKESKAIQYEIEKLNDNNIKLLKWIDSLRKESLEARTKMLSLDVQYSIMKNSLQTKDFDVQAAFEDAIQKAQEKNQELKNLLGSAHQILADIDAGLGGSSGNVSISQRLQSIAAKLAI